MTAPLLSLADVSLSFKGVQALNAISFAVAEGEICALIGPNGAGKSSLLNIINGVYRANGGEIVYAGERLRRVTPLRAARAGIGRTFQNNALFKRQPVIDNILAGMAVKARASLVENALRIGRSRAEERRLRARAEELVEFLDLGRHRDTPVGRLPYGLQKRVEIARALAGEPRLLLLDEPMAGMNAGEKAEIASLIRRVKRDLGMTIVLIEHDIGVVLDLSDHVVVLDYGRKIADGPPEGVRQNPDVIAAYLGTVH